MSECQTGYTTTVIFASLLLADPRIAFPLSVVPVLLCSLPYMTLSAPCRGPRALFIDSATTPWFARTLFWCISHIFHAKVDDSPGQSCPLVSDRHRWVSGTPEDHKKICFYWEMTSRVQCKWLDTSSLSCLSTETGPHAVLERDSVHQQSGAGLLSSLCVTQQWCCSETERNHFEFSPLH